VTFEPASPNLLEGLNGAGKSTLLEAVQRCLAEGHNTAGAAAQEMRPRETALTPSIAVVFGHAGNTFRISKTFLDFPKAQLERMRPDGKFEGIAFGKKADEQVREMLRSQASKAKENPGERLGLFSVLCSTQGKQELPALTGDALADIREMLGSQVFGPRGVAFEKAVSKKYSSVWTPGGKPKKGKLTDVRSALYTAREDLIQCLVAMQRVGALELSARNQRSLHQQTAARLHIAQGEHRALAAVAQQVEDLRTRRVPAESRVQTAIAKYDHMRAEIERIIDTGKKKRTCEDARPGLEKGDADARLALDTCVQELTGAQAAWEASSATNLEFEQLEQRAERGTEFTASSRNLSTLRDRVRGAQAADGRRLELESRLVSLNAPDPMAWRAIQAAAREFDQASVRVESLQLRIGIAAECDLTAEIVAGEPAGLTRLAAGETAVARGDGHLKIRLPGIAILDISGPSGDAAQWRSRQKESESLLGRLLKPFGVASWEDLAGRMQQREALSSEFALAKAEYAAALGRDDLNQLQDLSRELTAQCAAILLVEPSWRQHLPDLAALKAAANKMKAESDGRRTVATMKWQMANSRRSDAERAAALAESARAANETALADARSDLAALEADGKTVSERQQELNGRRREWEGASVALTEIDAALGPLPVDAPEAALAKQQGISALELEIQCVREAYRQYEAVASALLRQGPYCGMTSAEERVHQLEADEAAESRRLEAILRLRNVVEAARAKVLAGISEPVEERATALLERIVGRPFARVRLGDTMSLKSVRPEGCSASAAIEQMSSGEREQIYFATRLALADVLATDERQVVVLDDPLVDTDADRLSRALELIDERSDRLQFVILSCHPERYLGLPKLVLRHMDKLNSEQEMVAK
jgi:ABC-type Mn2+/Zn2+ transport system ATPase subunit